MFALLTALALCLPAAAQDAPRQLTPDEMEQDLLQVLDLFEREHAGLLRYSTREELDASFAAAFAACEQPLTVPGFQRVVSALASDVRCGHTRVRLGAAERQAALERSGLLPLQVRLIGERAWIRAVLADDTGLSPGQELLAIDGVALAELRARAFEHLYTDGFNESGKQRDLERGFAAHYALLIDDLDAPPGEHSLSLAGVAESLRVGNISPAQYDQRRVREPERPLFVFEQPAAGVGYLRVREFGDEGGGSPSFPEQLEAHFVTLRQGDARCLILDLRGNGGGDDMYGALLVSYLAAAPFHYFERIEVTPDYSGEGGVVERDGRRLVTAHPGLQLQQPARHAFAGRVLVLIDGGTFSTAADVATVLHHLGRARFLGEETGGGYDGNTSGMTHRTALQHSGLELSVPQWMYTTANLGHAHAGRGVPPDEALQADVAAVLAGRDVVLERALELCAGDRGR